MRSHSRSVEKIAPVEILEQNCLETLREKNFNDMGQTLSKKTKNNFPPKKQQSNPSQPNRSPATAPPLAPPKNSTEKTSLLCSQTQSIQPYCGHSGDGKSVDGALKGIYNIGEMKQLPKKLINKLQGSQISQ